LPLILKPETFAEVDGSPSIFGARDYNVHRRELVAIETALIGKQVFTAASGVAGFSCANFNGTSTCPNGGGTGGNGTNGGATSIAQALQQIQSLIDLVSNGGLFGQFCGTIQAPGAVPIPSSLLTTVCQASLLAGATSIPVESTAGFPSQGFITKFNNDPMQLECQASRGTPPPPGGCVGGRQVWNLAGLVSPGGLHATNQEFIQYASLTPTSFEGCTRGHGGTTAQDLVANGVFNTQALIANGRATIFLAHNFWGASKTNPTQAILSHDSMLNISGLVLQDGLPSNVTSIGTVIEAAYALTVIGQFDTPNVSGAFS
jgi:hypothetical protein